MNNWYASVNYGMESIIRDRLKACGAKNIQIIDSALVFSCQKELNLKCINNLFLIMSAFYSQSVTDTAKKISRLSFDFLKTEGKSFRVIIMDCGKLRSIPQKIMHELEMNIVKQTRLSVSRANPDIEIWINRRSDGRAFFMQRVNKHAAFDKKLKKGELRPDIADVMLYMAKINKESVVVDMFGGWGAIAAAADEKRYKTMLTGDINSECVSYQKERLKNKRGCIVKKWDAQNLPIEDSSVDAVVTDPPWGEYKETDTVKLYESFINEVSRILKKSGMLVFLSSAYNDSCRALKKYSFNFSYTAIKINGRDAWIFKAKHAGVKYTKR